MPSSTVVRIAFKRKLAMIGAWGRSRLGAQARAVAFVVVYLVLAQTVLLDQPVRDPLSVIVGIAATIAGLAFFLEGLFLGVMPLGERCGLRLPGRVGPLVIAVFALVLGVTATLAEPAIGILKLQGGSARPWSTPLLYLLLNRGSGWLVAAVAGGVGLAVALGVFRFLYRWPLKPFIFALIPLLVAVTFLFDADPNAMSGGAQHRGRGDKRCASKPILLVDIVQAEAGFLASAVGWAKAASGERIGATQFPFAVLRCGRFGHCDTGGVDHLEQTATLKVAADDRSQRARRSGFTAEIGNCQGNLVGTGTGDLDGQFRMRRDLQGEGGERDEAQAAQF